MNTRENIRMISEPVNEIHQLRNCIINYKREHTHCQYCETELIRVSAILDNQPLTKKMIEKMTYPISQNDWLIFKTRITVLCRFCSELHTQPKPVYFDLVQFQHYLRLHTPMKPSAVREYIVRLRRIDSYLASVNFTLPVFTIVEIERQLENTMTRFTFSNARCALLKYAQYLVTR